MLCNPIDTHPPMRDVGDGRHQRPHEAFAAVTEGMYDVCWHATLYQRYAEKHLVQREVLLAVANAHNRARSAASASDHAADA